MLALLLFVSFTQGFVQTYVPPGYLMWDKYIVADESLRRFFRAARPGPERWVPGAGTTCRLYVAHEYNDIVVIDGSESPWGHESPHNEADQETRLDVGWNSHWFDGAQFKDRHTDQAQPVNLNGKTWIWTSCNDALLIDYFILQNTEGDRRQWGSNDHSGWCLSLDPNDKDWFNSVARMLFDNYERHHRVGDIVVRGDCFGAIRLDPSGVSGIRGWRDRGSSPEPVSEEEMQELAHRYAHDLGFQGVTNEWRRVFAGENFELRPTLPSVDGSDSDPENYNGRRKLEDLPPSKEDIDACEKDPEKTEEDCMDLVREVFEYLKKHDDDFERLPMSRDEIENVAKEDSNGDDTDGDDTSEDNSNEAASSGIEGTRRRLFKLLA